MEVAKMKTRKTIIIASNASLIRSRRVYFAAKKPQSEVWIGKRLKTNAAHTGNLAHDYDDIAPEDPPFENFGARPPPGPAKSCSGTLRRTKM